MFSIIFRIYFEFFFQEFFFIPHTKNQKIYFLTLQRITFYQLMSSKNANMLNPCMKDPMFYLYSTFLVTNSDKWRGASKLMLHFQNEQTKNSSQLLYERLLFWLDNRSINAVPHQIHRTNLNALKYYYHSKLKKKKGYYYSLWKSGQILLPFLSSLNITFR